MKRIKERREQIDLTQRELAEAVGVAVPTISMYENGKREPDGQTMTRLASVLGCSVDYLLGVDEKPVEMSDFTFAMHGMERDLTEHDKAVLLQMAQTLKDARRGGR